MKTNQDKLSESQQSFKPRLLSVKQTDENSKPHLKEHMSWAIPKKNSLWMVKNFKIARNTGNIAKRAHRLLKLFVWHSTE